MAFFKFRWPGKQTPPPDNAKPAKRSTSSRTSQAQSVEEMRRRARHRLIGAAVLVLAGVVGFPLLFDTQPRPIPVNVAIDIPDRNKVAPLVVPHGGKPAADGVAAPVARGGEGGALDAGEEWVPSPPAAAASARASAPAPAPAVRAEPKPEPKPEPKAESKPDPKPEPRPEPKPEPKHDTKPEPKPEPRPEPKAPRGDDAARARALLEGREPASASAAARAEAPAGGRFIVQVGAFADADKAREVQTKLERAGLKAYTQAVDTKDGRRTRVRVGPFSSRAEADKAAERVKGVGLGGSVLAL